MTVEDGAVAAALFVRIRRNGHAEEPLKTGATVEDGTVLVSMNSTVSM